MSEQQRQIVAIPDSDYDPRKHELPILVGNAYHAQPVTLYQHNGQVYAESLKSADQIPDGLFMQPVEDRALVCAKGGMVGGIDASSPHLSVEKIWVVLK